MVQIENDVFAQIGLVMIIGLVAKNAILIVEFAKLEYENGATIADAALAGARLRFRPILMTSLALIAGCVPLALASGSGAVARQVMGTGVIGGMLTASGVAIFLIPAGFCIVERFSGLLRARFGGARTSARSVEATSARSVEATSASSVEPLRPSPETPPDKGISKSSEHNT